MAKKRRAEMNRRFDRRAMEVMSAKVNQLVRGQNFASLEEANKFLMENACGLKLDEFDYKPESPIEQAQYIMWDAFDEPSAKKRVALAEKALDISPDCADAYVLLAEDRSRSIEEELELYRKGVEAGRRALGEQALKDPETHFWSELKTRPYMRAMNGLACTLHSDGQIGQAIDLWQELLRLNPRDNQGIRMLLAPALVEADRLAEAEEILKQFDGDGSAHMLYSWALCLFKKHGDGPLALRALKDAIAENPHVIEYLCGLRKLPKEQADSYSPGSPEEAHGYISVAIESWINAEGAIDWLAEIIRREVQKRQLAKTFPGMTFESVTNNVVDLNSFRLH